MTNAGMRVLSARKSKKTGAGSLPPLSQLLSAGVVEDGVRVIAVKDKDLQEYRAIVLSHYKHASTTMDFIKWLLVWVAARQGGVLQPRNECIDKFMKRSDKDLKRIQDAHPEGHISLGLITIGVCIHRAMLFKYSVSRSFCL
jgi:hypothetical protein